MTGRRRLRDSWWLLVAIVFAILFVGNVIAIVVIAIRGPRSNLLSAPISLLTTYWFAVGAWLRTTWGQPALDVAAPPGPPSLPTTRATALILIAASCAVAVGVALAVQVYSAN